MGLSFRKSVKAGPFRFNLSGSGVGISVGVPGFRVETGPRGNYVSMSAGGFTYRKSLSSPDARDGAAQLRPEPRSVETETPPGQHYIPSGNATVAPMEVIQSSDIHELSDTDSSELVSEINGKSAKMAVWYWPLVLMTGLGFYILSQDGGSVGVQDGSLLAVMLGLTFLATFWLYQWDEARRSTVLFYDMDGPAEEAYATLLDAFEELRSCRASWRIEARGQVLDARYNAGASHSMKRKLAALGTGELARVKCNIDVPWLKAGPNTFYFFPDRLFIARSGVIAVCSYASLEAKAASTSFIEDEGVPSDSIVIGKTWRFVNKNGSPDRRFNNNRQIPIAQYEALQLFSALGVRELYHFSKVGAASSFVQSVLHLEQFCRNGERVAVGR